MDEFFKYMHANLLDPDRFPIAMLAMLLVAVVGMITGPSHGNINPWYWALVNKLFGGIGGRLDKKERKASDLLFRGGLLTLFIIFFSYLVAIIAKSAIINMPFYGVTEIVLLSFTMATGTLWFSLLKLYFAMKDGKTSKGAYYDIATSSRVNLNSTDDYGVTRTGMGLAMRNFDKALVAPVVWYLIAGIPGAYIYAGLAALSWRFGRSGYTKGFGMMALALEKLMGIIPNLFAGILVALAGLFTPTGGMTRALASLVKPSGRAKYEEGGLPLSAMAYALKVSLGGPVKDLDGSTLKCAWIGPKDATAKLESGHLRRALYIHAMAYLLFMATLLSAMLWGGLLS